MNKDVQEKMLPSIAHCIKVCLFNWLVTSASQRLAQRLTAFAYPLFLFVFLYFSLPLCLSNTKCHTQVSTLMLMFSFSSYCPHATQGQSKHRPPLTNTEISQPFAKVQCEHKGREKEFGVFHVKRFCPPVFCTENKNTTGPSVAHQKQTNIIPMSVPQRA